MNLVDADKHMLHPFTAIQEHEAIGPKVMNSAEGIHVYDAEGKQYIDSMAGLWCVNIGYGRDEMADAIAQQVKKLSFYHSFMSSANEPAIELADKLTAMAPGNLNHAFFCNSGSEANDTHVKMVWYYNNLRGKPDKKKIISRQGGYHGVTVAAASLGGLVNLHKGFDVPLERFIHVSQPHAFWHKPEGMTELEYSGHLAQELEDRINKEGADTIAAFIAEPVMGAAGVIPPPEGYFDAILPILKKHDILFIADEVICGFGRLGKMFGSEYYGFEPDMMTLAKGLTSGYIPMAACLITDEIYDVLKSGSGEMGPFAHGFTYTGHPVAAAAALKNLEIIERENLVHNAATVGEHFQHKLRNAVADHPLVGEVRGLGLIAGVELIADKEKKTPFELSEKVARKMHNHLLKHGLTCRPILNMLAFSPPLTVTHEDANEMVSRFCHALADLQTELDGA